MENYIFDRKKVLKTTYKVMIFFYQECHAVIYVVDTGDR